MKNKNVNEFTVEELKALAYDKIVEMENARSIVQAISKELENRGVVGEVKKVTQEEIDKVVENK